MNPYLMLGIFVFIAITNIFTAMKSWSLRGDHDEAVWAKKEAVIRKQLENKQDLADTMAYKYETAKVAAEQLNASFDKRLQYELDKPVFSNPACILDGDSLQLLLQNIRGTATDLPREPAGKVSTTP